MKCSVGTTKGGRSGLGVNHKSRFSPNPSPEVMRGIFKTFSKNPGVGGERISLILVIVVVAGPGQGKAGKAGETGPGQTKPRLGTTGKPAKPNAKQGGFNHQKSPGGVLKGRGV